MKYRCIQDTEYIIYIEKLPCMVCGFIPNGVRKLYHEYTDTFKEYPCKCNAHHCDIEGTRTKNDHRVVPLCGHYTVSGKGTHDCHQVVHSEGKFKDRVMREAFSKQADEYYSVYCEKLGREIK